MRVLLMLLISLSFSLGITLEQALEMAKKQASQIRLSEIEIRKAEEQIRKARAGILPQVSFTYSYNYLGQDLALGSPNNKHSALLQLNQTIFNKWVFEFIKLSQKQKSLQQVLKGDVERSLDYQVKDLFYALLYKKHLVELYKENLDYWQENYKTVKAKFEAGVVPKVEMLKGLSKLEQAEAQLEQAKGDYLKALEEFKALLRIEGEIDVEGSLEFREVNLDEESLVKALLENNTSLKGSKKALEVAQSTVELKKAQRYPTLSGFASYQIFTGRKVMGSDIDWLSGYSLGISLNYQIFDGFSRDADVALAEFDLLKQKENYLQLEYDLKANLRKVVLSINSLRSQINAVQSSLSFGKEALRLSTERYRAGVASQLEVLESKANYNNLLANYYFLLYQYNSALALLDRLVK